MNSLRYVHQLSSKLSGLLLIAGLTEKSTVTWVAQGLGEGRRERLSALALSSHSSVLSPCSPHVATYLHHWYS